MSRGLRSKVPLKPFFVLVFLYAFPGFPHSTLTHRTLDSFDFGGGSTESTSSECFSEPIFDKSEWSDSRLAGAGDDAGCWKESLRPPSAVLRKSCYTLGSAVNGSRTYGNASSTWPIRPTGRTSKEPEGQPRMQCIKYFCLLGYDASLVVSMCALRAEMLAQHTRLRSAHSESCAAGILQRPVRPRLMVFPWE